MVAGDGAQRAYILEPVLPFSYNKKEIINVKGTVGALCFRDIDGDGWLEFFVPDFDHGMVYGYTFAP
jgi:hypothetical protein